MQVGWVKIGDFRQITSQAISRKWYTIDAWFLLKSNRKSYALYRMVTLPMTLSDPKCPKLPQFVHFAPLLISRCAPRACSHVLLYYRSPPARGGCSWRAYVTCYELLSLRLSISSFIFQFFFYSIFLFLVPCIIDWVARYRVVSVVDSGSEWPGFKSQSRRCRVTVLGKLFTPIVPLFTKQQNWQQPN